MMDSLKKSLKSAVIGLFAENEGKVSAIVGVTQDLTDKWNAKDLIQPVAQALEAKGGGGRPDMAQCGGADASKIPAAMDALRKAL